MFNQVSAGQIAKSLADGGFKPNIRLTNMSTAFFQAADDYVATKLFPMVPVQLSTASYFKFSKADLARDAMQRKPQFGKVQPMSFGSTEDTYNCKVDQLIIGIDQISAVNYKRINAPGMADPRQAKVRLATEQAKLHLDVLFAESFWGAGIWGSDYAGVTTTPSGQQFYKFSESNSDPIKFFDALSVEFKKENRRRPNKLALGAETFRALKNNPSIIERVKYSGSSANPAIVNEKVLAELLGLEEVVVLESTYNKAGFGSEADMDFVCDAKGALLLYTTKSPQIDEATAGYTFTWDMLGDGSPMPVSQYEGEKGTHSEFIEALCAPDMKIVCADMGVYLSGCC